jgi:hypothetical protein
VGGLVTLWREASSPPEPPAPSGCRPGDCCTLRARAVGRTSFLGGFGLCYVASADTVGATVSESQIGQTPPVADVSGDYSALIRISRSVRPKEANAREDSFEREREGGGPLSGDRGRVLPRGNERSAYHRRGSGRGCGGVPGARCGRMEREAVNARPVGDVNGTNLKLRQTVGPRPDYETLPPSGELAGPPLGRLLWGQSPGPPPLSGLLGRTSSESRLPSRLASRSGAPTRAV